MFDSDMGQIEPELDTYLDEIVSESEPVEEEKEDFEKNSEGVFGDEWKKDEYNKITERIKRERNKKNAERRIKEKEGKKAKAEEVKETQTEVDEKPVEETEEVKTEQPKEKSLDTQQIEFLQSRLKEATDKVNMYQPVIDFIQQNKLDKESLSIGADFVRFWKADRVGCVKKLLTVLEKDGIDLDKIMLHYSKDIDVENEVHRRMQPYMQQQEVAQRQAQSRQILDGFLNQYPDANEHLGEIAEVMRMTGSKDPYDAYFRLRRAYEANNASWFANQQANTVPAAPLPNPEPQPSMQQKPISSRNVNPVEFNEPAGSLRDIIRSKASIYFGG